MKTILIKNTGIRPIVWKNDRTGKYVLHPGKQDQIPEAIAKELLEKYPRKDKAERIAELVESKKPAKKSDPVESTKKE